MKKYIFYIIFILYSILVIAWMVISNNKQRKEVFMEFPVISVNKNYYGIVSNIYKVNWINGFKNSSLIHIKLNEEKISIFAIPERYDENEISSVITVGDSLYKSNGSFTLYVFDYLGNSKDTFKLDIWTP